MSLKQPFQRPPGKPSWLRVKTGSGPEFCRTSQRLRNYHLHTVCQSAQCPNLGHCWARGRATIMILGDRCSRNCAFCDVSSAPPLPPDDSEPRRVAAAVRESGLEEIVITSVTRDDLTDGGAGHWTKTMAEIRTAAPSTLVEVLVPDFAGLANSVDQVIGCRPSVFGHNLETVPRLYPAARPRAVYQRSLQVLQRAADAGLLVKTSLMLGMGEERAEIEKTLRHARNAGCRIVFLGQYLQPGKRHLPVARYLEPREFDAIGRFARDLGFDLAVSAPLVRSSYHDERQTSLVLNHRVVT